jgi:hypothetical protein
MLVTVNCAYISVIRSCSFRYRRGFRPSLSSSNMLYLPVTTLVPQGR